MTILNISFTFKETGSEFNEFDPHLKSAKNRFSIERRPKS